MSKSNDVGYGKPPRCSRFKKGVSGNPKGRSKGSRNLKTDLLEELHDRVKVTEKGRCRSLTKQQALLRRLMVEALSGEHKPASLLLNLMMQFERSGDFLPATTPTSEEDHALLERYANTLHRMKKQEGRK
jgi:hypothetical protein